MTSKPAYEELEQRIQALEAENESLRQKEAQTQSEQPFHRAALDSLPANIAVINQNGDIVFVNQAWLKFAEQNGVSTEFVSEGTNYFTVCRQSAGSDAFEADRFARGIEQVLTGENPSFSMVYPCHSPEKARWFIGQVLPLAENKERHALVVHVDITGQKQAEAKQDESEKARQESETMLRAIIEASPLAIVLLDREGRVLDSNHEHAARLQMPRTAIIGQRIWDILPENVLVHRKQQVEQVFKTGAPINGEDERDGVWNEYFIHPAIWDETGQIEAVVVEAMNVTQRKQAEAEKARLEAQINQAQKLESVGRLAGGVAHDLNNLLTPVLGYSEMLLNETGREDPRRQSLKEIKNAAYRARNLVRQLLAFARKQLLEFQSINLNDLLKNFKQFLDHTLRENIAIEMGLAPNLPLIEGDRNQLEQVIMNLVINAQDAMPDGGQLTMRTERIELDESYAATHQGVTPGPYVMLAVSDTGCGMDAETRENLFEPFYTTKEVDKGTGLGLATVYGIVKQHGGNIWAYGEPGLGSVFKIYLPVSEKPAENTRSDTTESTAPVSNPQGSETIILVEDNPQVKDLALVTLEKRGYTVIAAENGDDALSLLKTHNGPIDLLLTDVVMPEMDGKQLYDKISDIYPEVRVLYMSGYSKNVIAHHDVIDEGVNFIQKPFSIKDLAAKVREVLDKSEE